MPRDINARLTSLRERRKGTDSISRSRIAAAFAEDALQKSLILESWERRATAHPNTRYALGAMQAVDAAYTQKSYDEAERVAKQLREGLSISVITRLQGSVPLDVHIRGVSDVDLLVLDADFLSYRTYGSLSLAGHYGPPSTRTSVEVLSKLRGEAEMLLTRRFWGATVDCTGAKCIALSGGSLERPVDVVPSHWLDTIEYQASMAEHDRGVKILNKKIPEAIENLPFKHIKNVHDRDVGYLGGLKKAIRLVKNVKNDAEHQILAKLLPSFDIAALMYHADGIMLTAARANELYILAEAQRFFDWCYSNQDQARLLKTPDGSRAVLDTKEKFDGLRTISCELDELAKQVAQEQGLVGASPLWSAVRKTLADARVPAAA